MKPPIESISGGGSKICYNRKNSEILLRIPAQTWIFNLRLVVFWDYLSIYTNIKVKFHAKPIDKPEGIKTKTLVGVVLKCMPERVYFVLNM